MKVDILKILLRKIEHLICKHFIYILLKKHDNSRLCK